jgi:hypothetical protein
MCLIVCDLQITVHYSINLNGKCSKIFQLVIFCWAQLTGPEP